MDIKFTCPTCQQPMLSDQANIGSEMICPGCNHTFKIPSPHTPAPSAAAVARPNPQLVKCQVCAGQLSQYARTCPHCGHPRLPLPARDVPVLFQLLGIIYLVLGILALIGLALTAIGLGTRL